MSYDSWDFEPVPEADSWDTWDTGPSGPGSFDAPAFSDFSSGGCNGSFGPPGGGFGGKGDFSNGSFGKGPMDFGKGPNDLGKGMGSFDGGKGCFDMGKGGFDGGMGPMDFGKGDFGKGDFGKGDFGKGFGKGDFGKGPMDFGKGPMDFGKGPMDFGKGDFGKGPPDFGKGDFGMGPNDFGKGCGKDSFDGGMGKGMDNFSLKGGMVVPPPVGGPGKGVVVAPPGAAPKGLPSGQFVAPPPRMPLQVMPPQKGFDGGKGMPPFGMKGPPGPGMQLGGCMQPPPPPQPFPPINGNLAPFAKQMGPGMAPEFLMEAENVPPPMDDGMALKGYSAQGDRKPRLFLLLTRLAPELQNEHMQQILEQCGEVQGWRRAKDPNGQPLSFGFAQFADPEAAWKANTCISKLVLCGQEIKVLLEEQTEGLITGWRNAQQATMQLASAEEFEWEMERKSVSCKAQVDAKVEEIYGPIKGGNSASKRREELRKKEQARILRVRKRKAWREAEFAKELERVESLEKRLRRDEREKDGIDRAKEQQEKPKQLATKDEPDLKSAKKEEFGETGGPLEAVGTLAVISNDNRVLSDLVDKIQSESRDNIFKMDLDVTHLRNEKAFEKKLRPWLERKVDLYMGGPQSDLVEYILRRVNSGTSADALISDMQRYLDDNAEGLVERMWRMLIFELMRSGQPMGAKIDRKD